MSRMLLFMLALGSASPCWADLVQAKGSATLTIQTPNKTPTIALADTITATLQIEGSQALRVQAPLELPRSAKWQLVERSKPERASIGLERVSWRIVYRFAPREPGEIAFEFPEVKFRDKDEQDQSAIWNPVVLTVTTQIAKLDRTDIRGVADIETLPAAIPDAPIWPLCSALAPLVAILVVLGYGWRRWFRRRVAKTPAEWALQDLNRLIALKLPQRGRSERFVTLLTLLVRRYLEKQFRLLARRQTTAEFLQHLEMREEFTAAEKQFLAALLTRCDASKFGGMEMRVEECERWADATRQFLTRRSSEVAQAGLSLPIEKFGQSG